MSKYLLALALLFTVFACSTETNTFGVSSQKSESFNLTDNRQDFSLEIPWNGEEIVLSPTSKDAALTYLSGLFSSRGFEHFDNVEVLIAFDYEDEIISNPIITLVGMGYKDGSQFPVAREFYNQQPHKNVGGSGWGPLGAGDVHSCAGDPCSCCEIKKEQYWVGPFLHSRVTGCKCNQNPTSITCPGVSGSCNHTVTSG